MLRNNGLSIGTGVLAVTLLVGTWAGLNAPSATADPGVPFMPGQQVLGPDPALEGLEVPVIPAGIVALAIPPSLKTQQVPEPPQLERYVKDKAAAIRLGKALFWDMQIGSDGVQACASCHFHAGADNRLKNQVGPGLNDGDSSHERQNPNGTLKGSDYPFTARRPFGAPIIDSNDVTSSQGVFLTNFVDIVPGSAEDKVSHVPDPVHNVNGSNVRRIEPRNTPTVINAVFNHRNFWDGRAQFEFNGVNPFGYRDPNAKVVECYKGKAKAVKVILTRASLASQAVGPPLSDREMSAAGRIWPKIGKKMIGDYGVKQIGLTPLGKQIVHPNDSVLASLAASRHHPLKRGLTTTYSDMIKAAFHEKWWDCSQIVTFDKNGYITGIMDRPKGPLTTDQYSVMEANFSLFFGIAVQLYEATLVSDDTPFDRFREGDCNAMTAQQIDGMKLFFGPLECSECHGTPEFTGATVAEVEAERIERNMPFGDGTFVAYDKGFYNIGVRPSKEDLGVGGKDPFGNPLSDTLMAQNGKLIAPLEANLHVPPIVAGFTRPGVNGNFKTPGLRNIEFTGPYFHNGGKATLRQVVEFYNRGGDYGGVNIRDLDPEIVPLGMLSHQMDAVVAFLKALTDERVVYKMAPFDHPQLFVPNGHPNDDKYVEDDGTGKAKDDLVEIAAVGANGGPAISPTFPHD
jgi:cytochrome c peroxidase